MGRASVAKITALGVDTVGAFVAEYVREVLTVTGAKTHAERQRVVCFPFNAASATKQSRNGPAPGVSLAGLNHTARRLDGGARVDAKRRTFCCVYIGKRPNFQSAIGGHRPCRGVPHNLMVVQSALGQRGDLQTAIHALRLFFGSERLSSLDFLRGRGLPRQAA